MLKFSLSLETIYNCIFLILKNTINIINTLHL
uniref:Uncharacterized protein n=1 Tax=viral metagenome TaxID=1070528 RepID=A0A6C0IXP9_9ZZZZ